MPAPNREGSLAVSTKDQTFGFEITQSQTNSYATDIKTAAQLMFAGNGERIFRGMVQYFLGEYAH
jgi:hypothetical protein